MNINSPVNKLEKEKGNFISKITVSVYVRVVYVVSDYS